MHRNRLGTVARFTAVLADYESVTRRARRDVGQPRRAGRRPVGDEWYYRNFALLLVNYAIGSYDDFDGEEDLLGTPSPSAPCTAPRGSSGRSCSCRR